MLKKNTFQEKITSYSSSDSEYNSRMLNSPMGKTLLFILLFILTPTLSIADEAQTKKELKSYFEVFNSYGMTSFGKLKPVTTTELNARVDKTSFHFISADVFAEKTDKSRRSAFYNEDNDKPLIYINRDTPPSMELLAHEIIRDKQYEISSGMAAIHKLHQNKSLDQNTKTSLIKAVKSAIDETVDRFGISASSPHLWVDQRVQEIHSGNKSIVAPGGDVSGGGGDDLSLQIKSQVLAELLHRLHHFYSYELGMSYASLQRKISNMYFLLSLKIYFETSYEPTTNSNLPKFYFGTDSIERIIFFPYLIQVNEKADLKKVTPQIVDVILQSDLFTEIPSLYQKQYSECECRGKNSTRFLGRVCPDPKKFHSSAHWLISFYQKDYERLESCKMIIQSEAQ